jgi:HEPN domain-containing protein
VSTCLRRLLQEVQKEINGEVAMECLRALNKEERESNCSDDEPEELQPSPQATEPAAESSPEASQGNVVVRLL